jgi:hypothetical protein
MQSRRGLLLSLVTGFVAMALVVGSVFADELLGVLSKVDVEGKKITIVDKDEKEHVITITDETKAVQKKKGEDEPSLVKVDLEKLETKHKKAEDAGKKINLKVTHEKGVASKIEYQFKKKKAE